MRNVNGELKARSILSMSSEYQRDCHLNLQQRGQASSIYFIFIDGANPSRCYLQWIQALERLLQMFATDIAIIISLDREEASRRVGVFEVYVRRVIL